MSSKNLLSKKQIQIEISHRVYIKLKKFISQYESEKHISIKEMSYKLGKIIKELDSEIEEENK